MTNKAITSTEGNFMEFVTVRIVSPTRVIINSGTTISMHNNQGAKLMYLS